MRVVFDHVAGALNGGNIGAAAKIILADHHVLLGLDVAQLYHALSGIGHVADFRVQSNELLEVQKGLASAALFAVDDLPLKQAPHGAYGFIVFDQPLQIIGVVDIGVGGVGANEAVQRCYGALGRARLVLCVGHVELGLFGVATKRMAGGQELVAADRLGPGFGAQGGVGPVVKLFGRRVFIQLFAAAAAYGHDQRKQQQNHDGG